MGIFIEEVLSNTNTREIVKESVIMETYIPIGDYLDLICEQCNDILLESYKEDMKITKEDLMNPEKLKQIIKRLEREKLEPTKKEKIAFGIVIGITALLGTATIGGMITFMTYEKFILALLTYIIGLVTTIGVEVKLLNRFTTLSNFSRVLNKIKECKENLRDNINKSNNEKEIQQLNKQYKSLNNIEQKVQDAKTRVFEIYDTELKNNEFGGRLELGRYLKTKKDKINYIKRLKDCINDEKDPKMKQSYKDHLKRVEAYRTDEEEEMEWWR